jgi:hypothetical protein
MCSFSLNQRWEHGGQHPEHGEHAEDIHGLHGPAALWHEPDLMAFSTTQTSDGREGNWAAILAAGEPFLKALLEN